MRLLLINPPRIKFSRDPLRTGTPLGLLSLAGQVKKRLPDVKLSFIDAVVEGDKQNEIKPGVFWHGLSGEALKARISEMKPDVVGIGNIFTCEWQNAAHCAKMVKELSKDITVIMGGHHPSFESEFMLRNAGADYIVRGEGELPFLELLKSIGKRKNCDIQGVAHLSEGKPIQTGKGAIASNLDDLEDPLFELLDARSYGPETNHCGGVAEGSTSLVDLSISRGCPNACNYCTTSAMWGRMIRAFSPERVREQVKRIANLGFDHVSVEDDHVLLLPEESRNAMFDELRKQSIPWAIDAGTYYPLIKPEFVKAAAQNGCYKIAVSFEHPVLETMHNENKYIDIKTQKGVRRKIAESCRLLREHGLQFYAAMMVGFRNESLETLSIVRQYARFIVEQGAQFATFFYWKPLPGTVDYLRYYHLVPHEKRWENCPENWVLISPVIKPDNISIEELISFVNEMSLEINGHPNTLINPKWK